MCHTAGKAQIWHLVFETPQNRGFDGITVEAIFPAQVALVADDSRVNVLYREASKDFRASARLRQNLSDRAAETADARVFLKRDDATRLARGSDDGLGIEGFSVCMASTRQ